MTVLSELLSVKIEVLLGIIVRALVLRQGVDIRDIGEPCSVQLSDGRVLTVYYWGNDSRDPILYIEGAIFTV